MSSLKILIGNDTPEQGISWANTLKSAGAFAITRKANGMVLLQYVKENPMPDVMIIEAKMAGLDAAPLIKELKKLGELPIIIVTAEYDMTAVREEVMYLGASSFLVKPFDANKLLKVISEAGERDGAVRIELDNTIKETPEQQDLECIVTDIIHQIGIPAHIKGYHFLRYAIMLSVENTEMLNCITKLCRKIQNHVIPRGTRHQTRYRACLGQRRRGRFKLLFRIHYQEFQGQAHQFGIHSVDLG